VFDIPVASGKDTKEDLKLLHFLVHKLDFFPLKMSPEITQHLKTQSLMVIKSTKIPC